MRLELGNLALYIGRRMNKIKGRDNIEQGRVTVEDTPTPRLMGGGAGWRGGLGGGPQFFLGRVYLLN